MKPPIRIAILECDVPMPSIQEKYGGYGDIFASLLRAGADELNKPDLVSSSQGLNFSFHDIVNDSNNYPSIEDVDLVLLTGSRHNAFDDDPWIRKLVGFTTSLLQQERVRTVGVCFGHQIIGRALDAPLGRSTKGWETSVTDITLSEEGARLFGQDMLHIHQMHRDALHAYPPNVTKLGATPLCDTQGMYRKGHLLTVQGHPEFNDEIMKQLLQARKDGGVFGDDVYRSGMDRSANTQDGAVVAKAFVRFALED